jgi:hypothetical protein
MERRFGNVKQLVHAIIAGLSTHPLIINPQVYYPGTTTLIPIDRYRSYGGYDLDSTGLTCSVYPVYSSRLVKGTALGRGIHKSVEYSPTHLGSRTELSLDTAIYTFVVELTYLDGTYGDTTSIPFEYKERFVDPSNVVLNTPHGERINLQETSFSTNNNQNLDNTGGYIINNKSVTFDIIPAEEILREYIDILRLVLNDMMSIKPYLIRNSQVIHADFPTSTWSRNSSDLVLHNAYLVWQISSYIPRTWNDVVLMQKSNQLGH